MVLDVNVVICALLKKWQRTGIAPKAHECYC